MYDPITAYVKQHITVTKSSQAANAILLLAAVCTAMSTFFVVTNLSWFLATLQYIAAEQRTSYLSTLFMYGCCTLAALISIVVMIQYYLLQWHTHAALIQRSLYWGILFLTMIPGYMILMYVASSADLMDICMLVLLACIPCYACMRCFLMNRIKKESYHPANLLQKTFLRALGIFILCMLLLQLLLPERLQPLLYMVLLAVPAFTLTGFGCRFLTAYRLFYRRREEFVEFEQMVYDEDAFTDDADIKERLTIRNTAATMTAADILEEFGFDRKAVLDAILANRSIATFSAGCYQDPKLLHILLQRLKFEAVPFQVERFRRGSWEPYSQEDYAGIPPADIHRRAIVYESAAQRRRLSDFSILGLILCMLFPANLYRPINWMSKNSMVITYHAFTFLNIQTLLHMLFITASSIFVLCSSSLQTAVAQLMQQSISTLWLISALFFFIELFHFPVYMRKLEAAIQEAEHKTHNYFVAAFLLYLISTLIKMIRRGFLTALCQLLILILSVEAARVILLCYRFIKYRRLTQSQILEQYEYYLPDTVEEDAQAVPGTSQ